MSHWSWVALLIGVSIVGSVVFFVVEDKIKKRRRARTCRCEGSGIRPEWDFLSITPYFVPCVCRKSQ